MGWYAYKPYVPVARRREEAARKIDKLKKKGRQILPVTIEGKTIAKSFWGKSWCENLEHYSDYENRLPRGRTYVRNGSVCDLQVDRGKVTAMVAGSELYTINVTIAPVANDRWSSICGDCAGSIGSLVELLQGKLSKSVMERVCRKGDGLFPAPHEIRLSCSCPDWADMCKHVAAALYGIGARLDEKPELLFRLRNVDESELIAKAGKRLPMADVAPTTERVMTGDDIGALFGIDIGDGDPEIAEKAKPARSSRPSARMQQNNTTRDKRAKPGKTPGKKHVPAGKNKPLASKTKSSKTTSFRKKSSAKRSRNQGAKRP